MFFSIKISSIKISFQGITVMFNTKYLNKLWHFAKYLGKSFLMQNNSNSFWFTFKWGFIVNYKKIILKFFFLSYSLKCFFQKMLPYTTVVISRLGLWYNSSNIRCIFCSLINLFRFCLSIKHLRINLLFPLQ